MNSSEVAFIFAAGTAAMLFMAVAIVIFAFFYQKRMLKEQMRRQMLEAHRFGPGQAPQVERPLVHGEAVVRQIPGPQGDAGGVHGKPQMVRAPDLKRGVSCEHAAAP